MHLLLLFCTLIVVLTVHCYVNPMKHDIKLIKKECLELPYACDDASDYL